MKSSRLLQLFFIMALALISTRLFALSWDVDSLDVSSEELKLLKERYPEIGKQRDIADLIRELARITESQLIQAVHDPERNLIIFQTLQATLIKDIELRLVIRTFKNDLQKITEKYFHQPDSPVVRYKLIQEIESFLAKKGFPAAKTSMQTQVLPNKEVRVILEVDESQPCLIQAVQYHPPDKITDQMGSLKNDLCDFDSLKDTKTALENLYEENGYFLAEVAEPELIYNDDKSQATIHIKVSPGNKIQYKIRVVDEDFNIKKLFTEDIITKEDASSVDPNTMITEIAKRYQVRGFADVQVDRPEVQKTKDDTYLYTYKVTLGPRYNISHIKFEGLSYYSESEAIEHLGLKGLWQDSSILNPEVINDGIDKLRNAYLEEGFWDAKIRFPNIGKDRANAQATLTFRVQEGKRRRFGKVNISGNAGISEVELLDLLKLEADEPIDQSKLISFEEEIKKLYVGQGYLYAKITLSLTETPTDGRDVVTDILVNIDEFKRTRIGNIAVSGLRITDQNIVTRELRFQTGDWYDPEAIAATRRSLLRLNIFRSVNIVPTDRMAITNPVENLDITVELVEAEPGTVSFGPGYSWPEGMHFTAETSYNNLWGQAKRMSWLAGVSEQRQQAAISQSTLLGRKFSTGYFHPYTFGSLIDTNVTLSHRAVIAEQNISLWQLFYSGEINFQYRFREWLHDASVSLFYGQNYTQEEGIDEDKIYLISTGSSRSGYVGGRFNIDKRNDIAWPSSGYVLDAEYRSARFGLGGNLKYDKFEIYASKFFGLTDSTTALLGLNLGSYQNIQWKGPFPDILPVSDRFTAGGIGSIRGFNRGSIGPYIYHPGVSPDGNDNINAYEKKVTGGSQKLLLKLEYRYKFLDSWAATAFLDSGTVFISKEEMRQYENAFSDIHSQRSATADGRASVEENLEYSFTDIFTDPKVLWNKHYTAVGPSLSWLLPIGSMNLACGFPIQIPKSEKCEDSKEFCLRRGSENLEWYSSYTCGLQIGGRF